MTNDQKCGTIKTERNERRNIYVQVYQWCGCPLRGSVCVRNDYGKYVKERKGTYNGQKERVGCLQENVARRGARNVALAETRLHRKEQESLQSKEETQKS